MPNFRMHHSPTRGSCDVEKLAYRARTLSFKFGIVGRRLTHATLILAGPWGWAPI